MLALAGLTPDRQLPRGRPTEETGPALPPRNCGHRSARKLTGAAGIRTCCTGKIHVLGAPTELAAVTAQPKELGRDCTPRFQPWKVGPHMRRIPRASAPFGSAWGRWVTEADAYFAFTGRVPKSPSPEDQGGSRSSATIPTDCFSLHLRVKIIHAFRKRNLPHTAPAPMV